MILEKELRGHSPSFHITVMFLWAIIYSHDGSAYSAAGPGNIYKLLPEKEYINGILVAVCVSSVYSGNFFTYDSE